MCTLHFVKIKEEFTLFAIDFKSNFNDVQHPSVLFELLFEVILAVLLHISPIELVFVEVHLPDESRVGSKLFIREVVKPIPGV